MLEFWMPSAGVCQKSGMAEVSLVLGPIRILCSQMPISSLGLLVGFFLFFFFLPGGWRGGTLGLQEAPISARTSRF